MGLGNRIDHHSDEIHADSLLCIWFSVLGVLLMEHSNVDAETIKKTTRRWNTYQKEKSTRNFWLDLLASKESVEASNRLPTGHIDGRSVVMMNVKEGFCEEPFQNV